MQGEDAGLAGDDKTARSIDRPLRKPIILIGAPSGAGKTALSQQIIAGELPFFGALCASTPGRAPERYDLKAMPSEPPRDRVLIIECATHKLEELTRSEPWQRMLDLIRESEQVVWVNLDVPRRIVVRQYFLRIFTGPKRMHVLNRVIQLSKYRNALIYMLTRQLARANGAWAHAGRRLATELAPRVSLVRARREGSALHLQIERAS
jgi:hypothetical protein